MISVEPAIRVIVQSGKDFNVVIFLDTMYNVIVLTHVKLCIMIPLIELYLFIPLPIILTIFHGHGNVKTVLTENFKH